MITVTPSPMLERLFAEPGYFTRLQPDPGRTTPSRPLLVWGYGLGATTRHQAVRLRSLLGMLPAAPDFTDPESQRVVAAAACAVAYELGREAGREYFAELIGQPKAS